MRDEHVEHRSSFSKNKTHTYMHSIAYVSKLVARNATPCSPNTVHTNTSDLLNHKLLTHFHDCQPAGVDLARVCGKHYLTLVILSID